MLPCQRFISLIPKRRLGSKCQCSIWFNQITVTNCNQLSLNDVKPSTLFSLSSKSHLCTLSRNGNILNRKLPNFKHSIVMSSNEDRPVPMTAGQKLKKAVAEYGSVVIVFHITISLISLGLCYTLISSGVDLAALLAYCGLNLDSYEKVTTNTGHFVVAYAVHKVFAPARIGVTLAVAPLLVKYLRTIGWLKQIPKKP